MVQLKFYSSYGCPRCKHMKRILEKLDVEYKELDIDKNPEYRKELNKKMENADRIPVLEKEGNIIHIGRGREEEIVRKLQTDEDFF